MASAVQLSRHDSHVLNLLFDAESNQKSEQSSHASGALAQQTSCETDLQTREKVILATLNLDKPDIGVIDAAINDLTKMTTENPDYASAYNNRAQARRMKYGDEGLLTDLKALAETVKDLAAAINLSTLENEIGPPAPGDRLASQSLFLFDVHKLRSLVSSFTSLLLHSFLALVVRFTDDAFYEDVKDSAATFYAKYAKSMLFSEMESGVNALQVLQSLCLLASNDILNSRPGSVFTTLGIAFRYAISKEILLPSASQKPILSANGEELSMCCWNLFYLDRTYGIGAPSISMDMTLFNELVLPELPASIAHREMPLTSTGDPGSLAGEAPDTGPQSDLGIGYYTLRLVSMWALLMGYLKQIKLGTNQLDPWMPNSAYNEVASQIFVFETICHYRHRFNRVVRTRDDSRRGRPQPPSFLQHTVDQATLHSRWITRLIDLCSEKGFRLTNPFLGHITGATATVQFFLCFSTDTTLAKSGAENFKKYQSVVSTMAEDWPHLKHTEQKLNKLAEIIPQPTERRIGRQLPRVSEGLIWSLLDYAASSSPTSGNSDQSRTVDVNMDVQFLSPPNPEASSGDDVRNAPRNEAMASAESVQILDDTLTLDLQSLPDIRGFTFMDDYWIGGQL
ncbi:hypothetical protein DV736_g5771, partial [Chaetothyriales sp. CBS 134916]